MERAQDVGEHEGNVVGQSVGEDGGQSGECILGANSDARNSAIGKDKNCSDGLDMLLDFSCNTPLVELVLLNTASVG